jgi:hypothetical protein
MPSRTPKLPTPSAGEQLVASILQDLKAEGLEPDSREMALLDRARVAADQIEALEETIEKGGLTYVDDKGVRRPSTLLAEVRQQVIILTRCLNGIQFDAGEGSQKDPSKVRAGNTSWAARRARPMPAGFGTR